MDLQISWQQVLQMETFLNNFVENLESMLDRLRFRDETLVNRNILINKGMIYTFTDAKSYLLSKYAGDKLVNDDDYLRNLFDSISNGFVRCEIDSRLMALNMKKSHSFLTLEELKEGILALSDQIVGFSAFFLRVLKYIIEEERAQGRITELTDEAYKRYNDLLINFNYGDEYFAPAFQTLNAEAFKIMHSELFNNFSSQCIKNNYSPPYSVDNFQKFYSDLKMHSMTKVIRNLNTKVDKLIVWDYNLNFSRENNSSIHLGKIEDIFLQISVYGLFHFAKILNLAKQNLLLSSIRSYFCEKGYDILDDNTGVDVMQNVSAEFFRTCQSSPFRIGKEVVAAKGYYGMQQKIVTGAIWVFDEINDTHSHLSIDKDENAEMFSTTFENILTKNLTVNLKRIRF